jgi:hypothetical protein
MTTTHAVDAAQAAEQLNEALSRLETALLSPVVSGEVESWARSVQEATAVLSQRLPTYLQSVQHPQYAEIAKNDAELLARVQQLIAEDQNLILEQNSFEKRAADFVRRASQIKKDEAQTSNDRMKVEQDGIALVLRIKRQRAAADTWMAEANYRDRGPVD